MDSLFFRDRNTDISISWKDFLNDLKTEKTFYPVCKGDSFYFYFKQIILSIIYNKEIILLDNDLSQEEIYKLIHNKEYIKGIQITNSISLEKKEDLLHYLKKVSVNWQMTIFTSGTTDIPKKVTHSFSSLSRFVKCSSKHKNDIWGFAYNPTHIANIQVFFQAILNLNTIVRLFSLNPDEIISEIKDYSVTHVSSTVTFLRLLLSQKKTFNSVRSITTGGEKMDDSTLKKINLYFPNAKYTNVYASTEAGTLFASTDGKCFVIKNVSKGLIKIINDELYIHKSLMAKIDNASFNNEWYATGDIVNIKKNEPLTFEFRQRKDDIISVGGYNVNPIEVEETIRSLMDIIDVRVYAKSNSVLGNIVGCDIMTSNRNLNEEKIRALLSDRLQNFKIPRLIRFVKNFETTKTGKLLR